MGRARVGHTVRLNANGRLQVARAMKDAIAEIAARDPRTASLLFS